MRHNGKVGEIRLPQSRLPPPVPWRRSKIERMEVQMTKTKTLLATAILGAGLSAILLPGLASADTAGRADDRAYCSALLQKYEAYLDMDSKRGRQPQSLESREAAARCRSGDPAGIAGLEKALNNARIPLPSRG
jgi:hypothetical protein